MKTKKRDYRYNTNKMSMSKTISNKSVDVVAMAKKLEKSKNAKEFEKTLNKLEKNLKDKVISTQIIVSLIEDGCTVVKEALNHIPKDQTVAFMSEQKIVNAINEIELNIILSLPPFRIIELFTELILDYQDLCNEMAVCINNQNGEIKYLLVVYVVIIALYVQRLE